MGKAIVLLWDVCIQWLYLTASERIKHTRRHKGEAEWLLSKGPEAREEKTDVVDGGEL